LTYGEAHCGAAGAVASACEPILGFLPSVTFVSIDSIAPPAVGVEELFILPVSLDFHLLQREALGRAIADLRRSNPQLAVHHDDVDPAHPLLVEALADQVARSIPPEAARSTGLILAASGHGDSASRAQSYRLMRLIWERLNLTVGEVGFLRHAQPFLAHTLKKCAQRPTHWVMLPQALWPTEHVEFAQVILENFQRNHPEAGAWRMAEPPGNHPAIVAWLAQRIVRLWNEKRARESVRAISPKSQPEPTAECWTTGAGAIASIPDRARMSDLLANLLPDPAPDRVLVKVTWHGYATGTYTDPAALDLLLGALPAPALVLEGHTSSRNIEQASFDWERHARANRAWIRQQDAEYLRRTGLADVLAKHSAQYVNVTDAYWDEGGDADPSQFIPRVLLDYAGCPMISFAKFKGPTRLAISNLFGLIPDPLRSAWHGPNITYFARVCCGLAKLYGAHFPLIGLNEALYSAVRWNRKGLYRSRWGNYDLISNAGYIAASRNLATADILASRLQGQDVNRSAFFDVVRAELGWDDAAATDPIPDSVRALFA
jgi:sirohydrochlorin ferrochelatase